VNRLEKAAAFGDSRDKLPALYGSRFIPNSKLQHEIVKERQRLVDEWEKGWDKGDNTDWGEHPDMAGFGPDFENRWSEAFAGPEFDKHFDMNRLQKAAAFGAMMGKLAAGDTWTAPNAGDWLPKGNQPAQQPRYTADNLPRPAPLDGSAYSPRENDIYKTRQDLKRKGDAVRSAAGAYGSGTATGTMRQGVVQPGATFTPQGQQPASNNIDWSSVTTQGGAQGSPQAAPSTPMQRWNQRVSDNAKAQAVKNKGTDKEIQSSSYTNPNAASFLPKPGSNTQGSPAPAKVAPKPASSPVMESKTPKKLF
jgi:hypothetical protein